MSLTAILFSTSSTFTASSKVVIQNGQATAIGRGLMSMPKLLMLDEPSLGLAPKLVMQVFDIVKKINEEGVTILLVEQNVQHALTLADRGYVLETGRIVMEGTGEELLKNPHVKKAYLGI